MKELLKNTSFNLPVNSVSFGQVSVAILREIYKLGVSVPVFPVAGQVDLSTQVKDEGFETWLSGCINNAQSNHNRNNRVVKLWHINGSLESFSSKGNDLITFHELDQLTSTEISILKQQRKVYVTSKFSQSVFKQFGVDTEYLPIGFDSHNFQTISSRPGKIEGVIQFSMAGKFERRKAHPQVLAAWAQKYGNNAKYRLNCALHNPFLPVERLNAMIAQALGGKQYWNILFHPWLPDNAHYNSFLQSSEIHIAMSGGEGYNLPLNQATALGAWPVALKAHVHTDYLNDSNAILVNPNGKEPAADGVFFAPNSVFNNGNIFAFDSQEFLKACEIAEEKAKLGLNFRGMELQKETYAKTLDVLLKSF